MKLLAGRTALVTGSSQGIGAAIALGLARAGANVVLHGLERNAAAEVAIEACHKCGVDTSFVSANLLGEEDGATRALFDQAMATNPNIDLLVNNAGTYIDTDFLEMPFDVFDRTMKLNVYAYFFLTQHFAQHWVKHRQEGRVLMIGSINGRLAEPTHAAYDTSKGAVEMMVKTLCVSLAPHNIRVNGVAPGLFQTPLTQPALDNADITNWMELHTPNGKIPGPEVCSEAAVYLLSDAAKHVTGQMLLVDGGMSAWQQPDMPR
ncbi:MAG: SDR family NAD(P)-dependent oxidoreductase [Planctomycetaceae bacterium]